LDSLCNLNCLRLNVRLKRYKETTMPDDVREAAERWDEELALEMFGEPQAEIDVVVLAKDYLAEHPEDGCDSEAVDVPANIQAG